MSSSTETPLRTRLRAAVTASAAALALTLTGTLGACNYGAAALFILEGPPTVEPVTDLDPERATVIFIDDRGYGDDMIVPRRALRREIGRVAENRLLERGVIDEGNMIRSSEALRVITQEPSDQPLSVVEIGRAVGAEVVIYAEITNFTISRNGVNLAPSANAAVTIFDAQENTRLAPEGGGAFAVELRLPQGDRQLSELDRNQARVAREGLAAGLGEEIARLFYEHERPTRRGTVE